MITQYGMTQGKAAEILGTKQPQVSELINGKLYKFSTDRLFRFLIRLSDYISSLNELDNYSRSESARLTGQFMKSPYTIDVD
ncbi:XRE family transcriptional regulator [Phormidium pseudopriestleyi FRX01]|uniref:XRE family transcriptional regulator n=2 Tax=Phormidium TaxID=1198 RepID=A0ABS3FZ18_9CYAN|nr:XRE family transcriptional regulator [Phormidium pseudopriestleyi FRX01]